MSDQAEIQLGHLCNNRCVFCVSGQASERREAPQMDAEPLRARIHEAYLRGARTLTLLGGEPTIQRAFVDVAAYAVSLNFDEIVIFTNGVMTWRRPFVERVLALGGRFTWRISVQGGDAAAHDAVTGRPGSFKRIMQSLEHLRDLGQRVTVNMCVNTLSYRSLPLYAELCRRYGIAQLHVDQVRPRDAGERDDVYLRGIMARYSDMAPHFDQMLRAFDEVMGPAYDVNVGNLPYCVLPRWSHRIHHDGLRTWTVAVDGGNTLSEPWDKYEDKRSDKFKPEACGRCAFNSSCNGIFRKYAEFYGTDEFVPVPHATAASQAPATRLVALAQAVHRRGGAAGLGFVGARALADRDGVALYFRAHGGGVVAALAEPAPDAPRPRIAVRGATDETTARALGAELAALAAG
jgi:MoaA/NifB/PqqE/SkfB family radical SAM enzyme